MALPLTRRPGALVASAASYANHKTDSAYLNRRALTWQKRALAYLDLVPELAYSSRFYARMLRPLRVFPGTLRPDGTVAPITDGLPVEMLGRLKGKDGTSKGIQSSYGRLMFATGEGNLLGLNIGSEDEYWSFVWNEEVEVEMTGDRIDQIIWRPMGNADPREYSPEQARVFRMWTPHPRRSGEADSPMRSVLEIAEELIALTASVRATATSRTVAGVLLMPTEMVPVPAEVTGDEDEESDPFVDEMLRHLESQVEEAGSAAAASPWVIWGAYELLDRIRMVQLHDPQTDYMERDLRKEAVERMARGMDFPAEYLMGLATANHWAAKQILDDMWRSHGTGIADQYVGDINDAYLRPGLRDAKYPGWEDIVIGWDESAIVVPADLSADADAAHDRGEIGGTGYRKLKNIPEQYKPTPAEHEEWLAIKLKNEGILGIPNNATSPPDPSQGPAPPGAEGDSGRKTRVVSAMLDDTVGLGLEIGAAEMALARCRELAGVRIRHKAQGSGKTPPAHPDLVLEITGQPNYNIAALLGPDKLGVLRANPATLVKGGAEMLQTVLGEWGYGYAQAAAISEMVESYAARTIFKSGHPTLPSGFAAQFERAKEASNVNT